MAADLHIGDMPDLIFTFLDEDGVVDISAASTKDIVLTDPSGNGTTKTLSFVTDGTDGKGKYSVQAGDLDEFGNWQVQGHLVIAGRTYRTAIATFYVHANLAAA